MPPGSFPAFYSKVALFALALFCSRKPDWFKKRKPALSLQALCEQTLREAQELPKYHRVRSANKFAEAQSLLEKIQAEQQAQPAE